MLPEVEADGRLREADVKRITDYYAREQGGISWKWQAMDSKHCAAPLGGQKTGNNPTDRGNSGAKINPLVDGRGAPISVILTAANRHYTRSRLGDRVARWLDGVRRITSDACAQRKPMTQMILGRSQLPQPTKH